MKISTVKLGPILGNYIRCVLMNDSQREPTFNDR